MNRTFKIFLACALGAFIGTLVALQLNGYLWWVGLIVGGIIGYLSYEFKAVRQAIATAWQQTFSTISTIRFWKRWAVFGGAMSLLGMWFVLFLFVFLVFPGILSIEETSKSLVIDPDVLTWPWESILIIGFIEIIFVGFIYSLLFIVEERQGQDTGISFENAKWIIRHLNPIMVLICYPIYGVFFILWGLAAATISTIKKVPTWPDYIDQFAIRAFQRISTLWQKIFLFIKRVFVLIHSDERLLCGLDAAIGVGIGYFSGNALIGGLAGGLFGVLNYEIVSKRWLHLPANKTIAP